MVHPDDAHMHGIGEGDDVVLGNKRGEVRLHARLFAGVHRGVLIAESIWPNSAYADGCGINSLTGADPIAPYGGAAFHDNRVWIRKARA
jgi:anaerobic selenocysteine-containing dehydrogenase